MIHPRTRRAREHEGTTREIATLEGHEERDTKTRSTPNTEAQNTNTNRTNIEPENHEPWKFSSTPEHL